MERVNSLSERLKIGGTEVGRKMSEGMSSMSFKVKKFFQGPNQVDKLVEDATSENLNEPDWATNLDLCDLINSERINSIELIRAIKKRIIINNPRIQYLALVLLETCVKNCEKAFSEVAAEKVLNDMVKLIDDPHTIVNNRNKALMLIEAWGGSTGELRYLPVYEETYKSLKSRGIRFPGGDSESLAPIFTPPRSVFAPQANVVLPQQIQHDIPVQSFTSEQTKESFNVARNSIELLSTVLSSSTQQDVLKDDLTTTLVQQCRQSQSTVQKIIETAGDNEELLFEALNVNDEIQKVLSKYEDLKKPIVAAHGPDPTMIPVAVKSDKSPCCTKEDALIRKPAGSSVGVHGGSNCNMMADVDKMISTKKSEEASDEGREPNKQQLLKDELITFN